MRCRESGDLLALALALAPSEFLVHGAHVSVHDEDGDPVEDKALAHDVGREVERDGEQFTPLGAAVGGRGALQRRELGMIQRPAHFGFQAREPLGEHGVHALALAHDLDGFDMSFVHIRRGVENVALGEQGGHLERDVDQLVAHVLRVVGPVPRLVTPFWLGEECRGAALQAGKDLISGGDSASGCLA